MCKREYFGTIKMVCMNDHWTAVLAEGKVTLHLLEDESQADVKFPLTQGDKSIDSIKIANDFLIMLDSSGKLMYYLIEDQAQLIEYASENPIERIFPNHSGTRCICIDSTGNGVLYNPVDNSAMMIPNF